MVPARKRPAGSQPPSFMSDPGVVGGHRREQFAHPGPRVEGAEAALGGDQQPVAVLAEHHAAQVQAEVDPVLGAGAQVERQHRAGQGVDAVEHSGPVVPHRALAELVPAGDQHLGPRGGSAHDGSVQRLAPSVRGGRRTGSFSARRTRP